MLSDILPTGFECGVLNGKVAPGSTVAIVGSGPIGLAALLTAQFYSPAEIIMVDLDDKRLAVAKRFGATQTVNSGDGKAVEAILKLTGRRGVDTAIEAVGLPATFELCEQIIAPGGVIANIGVHGMQLALHMERLWDRNISITTRLVDTVSTPMLLKSVKAKKLDPNLLITHHFKISKILDAYDTFAHAADTGALKVDHRRLAVNPIPFEKEVPMAYASVNPSSGKEEKSFAEITDAAFETKLAAAEACFETWRHKTYAARALIIHKASVLLHEQRDTFATIMTHEMGKRISEARGEVEFSARILEYYAKNAQRFLEPVKLHPTRGEAHMESSPMGVIFCVEPWNFPYYQLARVAGPHLMAGNVVMVKHAGIVPQCAVAFEKLLTDAGAPAGLYTNLFISHEQSGRVMNDRRIKGVALTGSVAAGQSLAADAGRNVKPSSMELGGADAFIVLEDADLEHAVKWAVWGRMYNAGQTCCAAKRFIVVEQVADKFLDMFHAALSALKPGDPLDETTTLGPLSSEAALLQLLKQVEAATAHGAKVALGGKRIDRPGAFMEPTILTDVKPGNPAFRDEFFGPVAMFFRVKDEDAAIALANDSDFGLGGSVFTKDVARGHRVASRVETGMMFINKIDWTDAELPFGGIKDSGYGRELGNMGIQEFVNKKLVRTARLDAPA
jgi:succinate-semialdehyde dehydrogenase/glutarate-semialdehyde dehydrogenase